MTGVGDQKTGAGKQADIGHLADDAIGIEHGLADEHALVGTFIEHDLARRRRGLNGQYIGHHHLLFKS